MANLLCRDRLAWLLELVLTLRPPREPELFLPSPLVPLCSPWKGLGGAMFRTGRPADLRMAVAGRTGASGVGGLAPVAHHTYNRSVVATLGGPPTGKLR